MCFGPDYKVQETEASPMCGVVWVWVRRLRAFDAGTSSFVFIWGE